MRPDASVTQWIDRLKACDPGAAQKLWERYYRRLVGLARKKLSPELADEEVSVLPDQYNTRSSLIRDVVPGSNFFNFHLQEAAASR